GRKWSLVVPTPSLPKRFVPQQNALPSAVSAQACSGATETDTNTSSLSTSCGTRARPVVSPSPILPRARAPQQNTLPSVRTPHVLRSPASIQVKVCSPEAGTGTEESSVSSLPSCP